MATLLQLAPGLPQQWSQGPEPRQLLRGRDRLAQHARLPRALLQHLCDSAPRLAGLRRSGAGRVHRKHRLDAVQRQHLYG